MKHLWASLLVVGLIAPWFVFPSLYRAKAELAPQDGTKPKAGLRATEGTPADDQAIRKAVVSFSEAFNKNDVNALLALWTEEGEFLHESGRTYRGKAQLKAMLTKALANFKGCKQSIKVESIRFIRPDVALQDGVSTSRSADGASDVGKFAAIWVKQDGKWLLSQVRDVADTDEEDKAPAASRLKQLAWLVGEWQDKEGKGMVRMTCRWGPGQTFLIQDYVLKQADGKDFSVTQYVGFDAATQQLRSWVFDSGGGFGGGLWTREGNSWESETEGVYPDGRVTTALETLKFVDDNTATWSARNREVDEQPLADVELTFVRKTKAP